MKRLLSLGILLAMGWSMYAAQLTEAEAYRIAQKYNAALAAMPWKQQAPGADEISTDAEYYVFNASDNKGFVIVSGEDNLTELVGYSDSGTIDMDHLPESLSAWLDAYAEYVRAVRRSEVKPMKLVQLPSLPVIRPLLKDIMWNQGMPYNDMCPYDEKAGERCPTGCMVTSFSQVMKYWQWPETGVGSHSYQSNYGELSANFAKTYDWSKLRDSYNVYYNNEGQLEKDWSDEEGQAIAQLMYDLGVAVEMSYTPSGSGASVAASEYALRHYFKYDAKYYRRGDLFTSDFLNMMVSELQNGRPVVMAGYNENSGHAFVLDGCNSDGYFHVNWGWGGMSNGYFNVNYLSPSEQGIGGSDDGYYLNQEILTMQPYYDGDVLPERQVQLSYVVLDDTPVAGLWTDVTSFDKNGQLDFKIYGLWNNSGRDFSGNVRACVKDESGNTVVTGTTYWGIDGLSTGYLYKEVEATELCPDFSQLSDGRYYMSLESCENGYEDEWISVSTPSFIILEVAGNRVNVIPNEIKLEMNRPMEGPAEVYLNEEVSVKVVVDNVGQRLAGGDLLLKFVSADDNSSVGYVSKYLEIPDNVSYEAQISFSINPQYFEVGKSYDCSLAFKEWGAEEISVTTDLAPFRFTVMEGEAPREQLALGYYDMPGGHKGGLEVETKKIPASSSQDILMWNLTNYNDVTVRADVGFALYDVSGDKINQTDYSLDLDLNPHTCLGDFIRFVDGFTALDSYEDGTYYFEALTREIYEGMTYDWIRMMQTSRIHVQKDGYWSYVYNPENYLKVKNLSILKEPVQDTEMMVAVDLENMGMSATSGTLEYVVYRKGEVDNPIDTRAAGIIVDTEERWEIPVKLTSDRYVVGEEYVLEISAYTDNADAEKTFIGKTMPFVVLETSGVGSTSVASSVYPNPAVERVTVAAASAITSVELYSVDGGLLLTVPADGQTSLSVDLGSVPAGVYVMMVRTDNGVENHRIVKK